MLRRAAVLAVVVLAAGAARAEAASVAVDAGGVLRITLTATGNVNDPRIELTHVSGTWRVYTVPDPEIGSGCGPDTPGRAICAGGPITRVVATGSDQSDLVLLRSALPKPVEVNLRGGDDQLHGPEGAAATEVTADGGDGADLFLTDEATVGTWDVQGGLGEDEMEPGPGVDRFRGGPGLDSVDYSNIVEGVTVTLDDQPGDGGAGESDDIGSDVEDVEGSDGNDVITGSPGANILDGRGGNDRIIGLGAGDLLLGGPGDDNLFARDGVPDSVDCDEGTDSAELDVADSASDCETALRSDDAQPDADGDGARKPADCDDRTAAVRPGATEVPENGVDEDCDGADAIVLDRDRDGIQRPADCDDLDPTVRPGTQELLGNLRDENCDGRADPFPTLVATLRFDTATTARSTRVRVASLGRLEPGQRATIACKGRGCPRRSTTLNAPRRGGKLTLTKIFRRRQLRPGAVVTVTVSDPRGLRKVFKISVERGQPPVRLTRCAAPPDNRLRRCT